MVDFPGSPDCGIAAFFMAARIIERIVPPQERAAFWEDIASDAEAWGSYQTKQCAGFIRTTVIPKLGKP